jgi:hypothetical protein
MDTTFTETAAVTCESCGQSPARRITVRRHVGMLIMQQFISLKVTACRPCGRRLIRSHTGRTLWQGWWGMISFFFNWFVLMANAWAWFRLGRIDKPSLSGTLMTESPRGFGEVAQPSPDSTEHTRTNQDADDQPKQRSKLRKAPVVGLLAFAGLAVVGWSLDATDHGHSGGHGAPASAAMVEQAMTAGPFTSDDGSRDMIDQALCTGDGEAADVAPNMYTHFKCQVAFGDGTSGEILVHILVGDELFFKKETSGY